MTDIAGLIDEKTVAGRLESAGLSAAAAADKADLFARCAKSLLGDERGGDGCAFFVPGRVEVLGKHTDYAGGCSLTAAAEKGFCIVASASDDQAVSITDANTGESVTLSILGGLSPRMGHWSNYPATVVSRLAANFPGLLRGVNIAFASDLPRASGMSSSSAFVTGSFLAISAVNELDKAEQYKREIRGPESLAAYIAAVENGSSFGALAGKRGVGTRGGSEDHTAILCSRPGELGLYSYCPVRRENSFAMPEGLCFVIASSGVAAEKTGDALEKYNRAARLAAEAVRLWNSATGRRDPHLAAAIASGDDAVARIRDVLRYAVASDYRFADITARFEHFLAENFNIIPAACGALQNGDVAEFGRQVDMSQQYAEQLLGNQIPATSFLAASARELGAAAASAFGAGFGGSVWAMSPANAAEKFCRNWRKKYAAAFPAEAEKAEFFATAAGPAAFEIQS